MSRTICWLFALGFVLCDVVGLLGQWCLGQCDNHPRVFLPPMLLSDLFFYPLLCCFFFSHSHLWFLFWFSLRYIFASCYCLHIICFLCCFHEDCGQLIQLILCWLKNVLWYLVLQNICQLFCCCHNCVCLWYLRYSDVLVFIKYCNCNVYTPFFFDPNLKTLLHAYHTFF